MVRIIKENEEGIHRWDLIDEAYVSIRDYNMIKNYMLHKFEETVSYDKFTQMWTPLKLPGTDLPTFQKTLEGAKNGKAV